MSKKKFKDRKIGKFLMSPIVKTAIEFIPFGIGSAAGSILGNVKASEPGSVDKEDIKIKIAKILMYVVIAYLIHEGVFSVEDGEAVKGIIGN